MDLSEIELAEFQRVAIPFLAADESIELLKTNPELAARMTWQVATHEPLVNVVRQIRLNHPDLRALKFRGSLFVPVVMGDVMIGIQVFREAAVTDCGA